MGLAQVYEEIFSKYGLRTAQLLLTHEDLTDRTRYLNARTTLATLLDLGVIPIINENDTVVTDEIKFGDNDTLGALVANLMVADALIILTDQKGLYTADTPPGSDRDPGHRGAGRRPHLRSDGRRRGHRNLARRHDHEDPGRSTRRPQRRTHVHRQRPANPKCCSGSPRARRWAPCSMLRTHLWPRASSGWPTT